MHRTSLAILALVTFPAFAPSAAAQTPLEDVGLIPATPPPGEDLVIVREKSYGAGGVDLTAYGIGTGPVDYVQSVYFRLYKDNISSTRAAVAGRVVFPPEATIIGVIVDGLSLGGSTDNGTWTATDAVFGIGTDPDLYSEAFRGFETTEAEFVCQATDHTLVFGLSVSQGVDDFRVILDYGSSFPADMDFSVYSYDLPELGGAPISPGYQIGEVSAGAVQGSGIYADAGSLIGIPLTTNSGPVVGCDITTSPNRNVYLLRDTNGDTQIDGFDVDLQLPAPELYSVDSGIMSAPTALTAGPDNLLYALAEGSGYAVMDAAGGLTNQVAIQDLPGDYVDMTYIDGGRELYIVRNTSSDTFVDVFDVDTLLFTASYPIPAATISTPIGIAAGSDGLLYVTGTAAGFATVDPLTGVAVNIGNSPPAGSYDGLTARAGSSKLYFVRDTSGDTKIDTYDITSGLFAYDVASFPMPGNPVGLTIGPDDLLYVVGAGSPGAAALIALDPDTGVSVLLNQCMDFTGGVVDIAFTVPGPQGIYCTAKTNSQGCDAQISFTGSASMSSPSPFLIECSNALNNKNGCYSTGSVPIVRRSKAAHSVCKHRFDARRFRTPVATLRRTIARVPSVSTSMR